MIDADRIAPGVYIGGSPPYEVGEHGFDMVVLCASQDIHDRDVPTIKVSLDDTEEPMGRQDITRALAAAHQINLARARGMRVLVTCQAGVNRSSFVVAIALILSGWTAAGAVDTIREKRNPPIGLMPLCNRMFVSLIHKIASGKVRPMGRA